MREKRREVIREERKEVVKEEEEKRFEGKGMEKRIKERKSKRKKDR